MNVINLIFSYTLNIEAVSCDELYADITEVCESANAPTLEVAAAIRRDVQEATKCPASAGLGPNLLVARLATKKSKPNGQFFVSKSEIFDFVGNFPVKDLPGIGSKTISKLKKIFDVEFC